MTDYNLLDDELDEPASHNKRVALIIAVLALLLTLADILGQSAQTRALQSNIEASNIWSFYQAKHMRETALKIAADEMETNLIGVSDEQRRKAMQQRVADWRATAWDDQLRASACGLPAHQNRRRPHLQSRLLPPK